MTSASKVRAATGIVKVKTDKDNGNTDLDIKVDHLAHPSSLFITAEQAKAYLCRRKWCVPATCPNEPEIDL